MAGSGGAAEPRGDSFRGGNLEGKIVGARILPPFFPLAPHERTLNLGCGEGAQAIVYDGRCAWMACADYDFERLRFVRQALRVRGVSRVGLLRCDAGALPFRDGEFDAALAVDLLEHLPDPAAALRELARVLRPNGRLLASFPLLFDFYDHAFAAAARLRARLLGRNRAPRAVAAWDRHQQERSAGDWKRLIAEAGLRVERMRASTLVPPLQLLGVRRFWIEIGALRTIDGALCSLPGVRRFGQAMLVSAAKALSPGGDAGPPLVGAGEAG